MFGVTINPVAPTYVVQVVAPDPLFKCTGQVPTTNALQQMNFQLTGARGAPGPVSGTETFTVGTSTIKVSYNMAPSR
jgi:hypothetical protein